MTYCKLLAKAGNGVFEIQASEEWEKFAIVPKYRIYVIKIGDEYTWDYVIDEIKCAKTTWKKKFKQTVEYYSQKF